jgi:hypothetical protein
MYIDVFREMGVAQSSKKMIQKNSKKTIPYLSALISMNLRRTVLKKA